MIIFASSVAHSGALKYHLPLPEIGKDITAVGEHVTPRRFAAVLSTTLGKTISLRDMALDEFEPKTPQEIIVYELHTMFQ